MRGIKKAVAHLLLFTFGVPTVAPAQVTTIALPAAAGTTGGTVAAQSLPLTTPASAAGCDDALRAGEVPLVTLARTQLWPANHALVDVALTVDVGSCAGRASVHIQVSSDEPSEDQTGDGDQSPDATLVPPELFLRSERKGDADGRVYLVLAKVTAPDGLSNVGCAVAGVPKSRSRADLASLAYQMEEARAYCEASHVAPNSFFPLVEGDFTRTNQRPAVDAGPDQGVDFPGSALLQGKATDDGLPAGVLQLTWSKLSGPGTVAFSAPNAEDTSAAFSEAGTYVLELTADDGQLHASDTVTVVVAAANTAPTVDAGPDQSIVLPTNTAILAGQVGDDGRPDATLTTTWTVVSVPQGGQVTFTDVASLTSTATFSSAGEYVLQLTADDTQLQASDTMKVTVSDAPPPILSVADVTLLETHEGTQAASVPVTLSSVWPRPVSVDYMTVDGTASVGCDYKLRYGTLTLEPGQTQADIVVPVIGEVVPEADETVILRLGNATESSLARSESQLVIQNDDASNQPPAAATGPTPADRATGVALPPTLSWNTSDADAGDAVASDVYLGTAFGTAGQTWTRSCSATRGPQARSAPASAYDEANDRLMIFGGDTQNQGDADTLWILSNASATTGTPLWTAVPVPGGPTGIQRATASYDVANNRLIVHGGCTGECATASADTWVLTNANGLAGTRRGFA